MEVGDLGFRNLLEFRLITLYSSIYGGIKKAEFDFNSSMGGVGVVLALTPLLYWVAYSDWKTEQFFHC